MLACPTGFPHVLPGIWNLHYEQQLATSYRSLLANYGTEYLPKEAFDWAWASEEKSRQVRCCFVSNLALRLG